MKLADGTIEFGEWLPDIPQLNSPGLRTAENVIPANGRTYKNFAPILGFPQSVSLPGPIQGVFYSLHPRLGGTYQGDQTTLVWNGATVGAGYFGATNNAWAFDSYQDYLFATNGVDALQSRDLSGATLAGFSSITAAPISRHIGVIGQFVMLGDLPTVSSTRNSLVRWSGIDAPLSWPTPNSATAIAQQSGEQYLDPDNGHLTGIAGGDQFGIIFQSRGITRVTYVGGNTVFQFDNISENIGCLVPRSVIRIGDLTYFLGNDGFYVTDGVNVRSISDGKITRFVSTTVSTTGKGLANGFSAAYDDYNKCIYWKVVASPPLGPSALSYGILIYSIAEDRWSHASQNVEIIYNNKQQLLNNTGVEAIFAATTASLTSIIETGEFEPNPGGFARIQGVKPLTDQTSGALVQLGVRNDRAGDKVTTYSATVGPTARTGFADFRQETRYASVRLTLQGPFENAHGIQYQYVPSGVT